MKINLQAVCPCAFVLRRGGGRLANSIPDQDTQFDHWQSFIKYFGEFASGDCGLGDVCTAYVPDLPMIGADAGAAELCIAGVNICPKKSETV